MPNSTDFQTIVGIDIAKSVFQVYSCDTKTGIVSNEKIKRDRLLEHFTNVPACKIGMEACGSSQYWARKLTALGHTVKLMDPKLVKPFVSHNKSDRADAEGIYHALQQGTRCVPVKNDTERDIDTLLTLRARLVKLQTGDINHVRGLLAEYGQIMPRSTVRFLDEVGNCINSLEGDAAQAVIEELRLVVDGIRKRAERIKTISSNIAALAKKTKHAANLLTVPGVGIITMAYMCVLLSEPQVYSSGRQFAAFLGLVPMHTGSGGKTITTHIPMRCNQQLRALMIECAQAVARAKCKTPWVSAILAKKPKKVALVAIANRIARQCWAVASKGEAWKDLSVTTA